MPRFDISIDELAAYRKKFRAIVSTNRLLERLDKKIKLHRDNSPLDHAGYNTQLFLSGLRHLIFSNPSQDMLTRPDIFGRPAFFIKWYVDAYEKFSYKEKDALANALSRESSKRGDLYRLFCELLTAESYLWLEFRTDLADMTGKFRYDIVTNICETEIGVEVKNSSVHIGSPWYPAYRRVPYERLRSAIETTPFLNNELHTVIFLGRDPDESRVRHSVNEVRKAILNRRESYSDCTIRYDRTMTSTGEIDRAERLASIGDLTHEKSFGDWNLGYTIIRQGDARAALRFLCAEPQDYQTPLRRIIDHADDQLHGAELGILLIYFDDLSPIQNIGHAPFVTIAGEIVHSLDRSRPRNIHLLQIVGSVEIMRVYDRPYFSVVKQDSINLPVQAHSKLGPILEAMVAARETREAELRPINMVG